MIFEAKVGDQTFRLEVRAQNGEYTVGLDGRTVRVLVSETGPFLDLSIDGQAHEVGVFRRGSTFDVALSEELIEVELSDVTRAAAPGPVRAASGPTRVTAPMPGKVARVLVTQGQTVAAGAGLLVIEAMKMENELRAPRSGTVLELLAREGQAVESGALLAVVG
jgi:glutaconyl-CoA/methylmalonyl-CoA decarboxylase subunit gamma